MAIGHSPVFKIMHEGKDITDRFNDRTTQIQIDLTSGNGQSDTCKISVDDRDFRVTSPEVGAWLEVYLGYAETGLDLTNAFEIATVTYEWPPKSISITGTGIGFQTALKAPAMRAFDNQTLGDIVGEIAKSGGVLPIVSPGLANKVVPFLNQTASPLHLLHELERRFGAVAKFDSGRLTFVERDSFKAADGRDLNIIRLGPEDFARGSVRHEERGRYSGVKASWFDKDKNETVWIEEMASGPIREDGGGPELPPFRMGRTFNSREEAVDAARSQVGALRRSMGEVNVVLARGQPWIRDSMRLVIERMRDGINGSYTIDTATHTFTKDVGLSTTLLCKPGEDA